MINKSNINKLISGVLATTIIFGVVSTSFEILKSFANSGFEEKVMGESNHQCVLGASYFSDEDDEYLFLDTDEVELYDDLEDVNGLKYVLDEENETATLEKCENKNLETIKIPGFVFSNSKKYEVTQIGNSAFEDCRLLKSVEVSENVKSIGNSAFRMCVKLKSIKLPSKLQNINNLTFYCCIDLEEINMPQELENIGYYAFYNCCSLKN